MSKQELRNIFLLKQKNIMTQSQDLDIDDIIITKALEFISKYNPKIVGIYLAQNNEIDIVPIILKCPNTIFVVPKIITDTSNEQLYFTNYYMGAQLQPNNKYSNYLEPISEKKITPNLIFIPGIAFDQKGYRLGRGKGHYDKFLSENKVIKVGICISSNFVTRLPTEPHDICMDHIISENMILNLV